jgi:hypothetical protein
MADDVLARLPVPYRSPALCRLADQDNADDAMWLQNHLKCMVCKEVTARGAGDPVVRMVEETRERLLARPGTSDEEFDCLARRFNDEVVLFLERQAGAHGVPPRWNYSVVSRHFRKCQNAGVNVLRLREAFQMVSDAAMLVHERMLFYTMGDAIRVDPSAVKHLKELYLMQQRLFRQIEDSERRAAAPPPRRVAPWDTRR